MPPFTPVASAINAAVVEAFALTNLCATSRKCSLLTRKKNSAAMRSSSTVSDWIYRGRRCVKLNTASIVLTIATPFGSSVAQYQRFPKSCCFSMVEKECAGVTVKCEDMRQYRRSGLIPAKDFRADKRSNQLASAERRQETERR